MMVTSVEKIDFVSKVTQHPFFWTAMNTTQGPMDD